MDKSFAVFLSIALLSGYLLLGLVSKFDEEGNYNDEKKVFEKYIEKDSIGDSVLYVGELSLSEQIAVWEASPFKIETMKRFPDFEHMKFYVKGKVYPQDFQQIILDKLDQLEEDFISGKISQEQVLKGFKLDETKKK